MNYYLMLFIFILIMKRPTLKRIICLKRKYIISKIFLLVTKNDRLKHIIYWIKWNVIETC